jgi:hypothetical protein
MNHCREFPRLAPASGVAQRGLPTAESACTSVMRHATKNQGQERRATTSAMRCPRGCLDASLAGRLDGIENRRRKVRRLSFKEIGWKLTNSRLGRRGSRARRCPRAEGGNAKAHFDEWVMSL